MKKKIIALFLGLSAGILFCSCGNEPYVKTKDNDTKVNIGFMDAMDDYEGYLDNVKLLEEEFSNQDYDNDKKTDRVYQYLPENGGKTYEIRFGNGKQIEIGPFDDLHTYIKLYAADLTGDGKNEIIFCGELTASDAPDAFGSEIAVWTYDKYKYKKMELTPSGMANAYNEGYPIYVEKTEEDYKVLITCAELDYEETYTIPLDDRETFDAYYPTETKKKCLMNERAWRVTVNEDDGTLSLYESVLINLLCEVKITLRWEGEGFKVTDVRIES